MSVDIVPQQMLEGLGAGLVKVPLQAIYSSAENITGVWLVNPETSRVTLQAVELGEVLGSDVVVTKGLVGGEQIVTAGVSQLREAMLVRPL
jgi:multidrug efflux pump subunit AcrA (membrane-fusion protein)